MTKSKESYWKTVTSISKTSRKWNPENEIYHVIISFSEATLICSKILEYLIIFDTRHSHHTDPKLTIDFIDTSSTHVESNRGIRVLLVLDKRMYYPKLRTQRGFFYLWWVHLLWLPSCAACNHCSSCGICR